MKPTVGQIVHYQSYGSPGGEYASQCRAAIVTEVCDNPGGNGADCASLAVLNPTGAFFNQHVPADEESKLGGTWHWMES